MSKGRVKSMHDTTNGKYCRSDNFMQHVLVVFTMSSNKCELTLCSEFCKFGALLNFLTILFIVPFTLMKNKL